MLICYLSSTTILRLCIVVQSTPPFYLSLSLSLSLFLSLSLSVLVCVCVSNTLSLSLSHAHTLAFMHKHTHTHTHTQTHLLPFCIIFSYFAWNCETRRSAQMQRTFQAEPLLSLFCYDNDDEPHIRRTILGDEKLEQRDETRKKLVHIWDTTGSKLNKSKLKNLCKDYNKRFFTQEQTNICSLRNILIYGLNFVIARIKYRGKTVLLKMLTHFSLNEFEVWSNRGVQCKFRKGNLA